MSVCALQMNCTRLLLQDELPLGSGVIQRLSSWFAGGQFMRSGLSSCAVLAWEIDSQTSVTLACCSLMQEGVNSIACLPCVVALVQHR